jgi:hypothetical protein
VIEFDLVPTETMISKQHKSVQSDEDEKILEGGGKEEEHIRRKRRG